MKCYRCNNILNENDEVCNKCGSMVIKYKSKEKVKVEKVKKNYSNEYYNFSIGCIITRFISYFVFLIFPINIIIPWLLISLIFSLAGYFKFNDKRNLKIIIIDGVLIILEIVLFIIIYKFVNS